MELGALSQIPPWDWPSDADQTLLRALRDDATGAEERLLAVQLAGDTTVMNDDIARALLGVLRDRAEPDEVRGLAAISLGPTLEQIDLDEGFDDEDVLVTDEIASEIRQTLRDVYMDAEVPTLVRWRVLEAAVRSPTEWHVGAVRAAYGSGDDAWRLTAVFCMGYVRGFEPEILETLASGDPALRYEAVKAAGGWGLDDAWPHVRSIVLTERANKPLLLAAIDATHHPVERRPCLVGRSGRLRRRRHRRCGVPSDRDCGSVRGCLRRRPVAAWKRQPEPASEDAYCRS